MKTPASSVSGKGDKGVRGKGEKLSANRDGRLDTTYCEPDKKKAVIQSLAGAASIAMACEAAGISRPTFYTWLRTDKKFYAEVEEAQLSRVRVVEDAMFKSALMGKFAAQEKILRCLAPKKWAEIQEVKVSGYLETGEAEATQRERREKVSRFLQELLEARASGPLPVRFQIEGCNGKGSGGSGEAGNGHEAP